jgi:glutaredoxin-related protein
MLRRLIGAARKKLQPLGKRLVRPIVDSSLGEAIPGVSAARRRFRQLAAQGGLCDSKEFVVPKARPGRSAEARAPRPRSEETTGPARRRVVQPRAEASRAAAPKSEKRVTARRVVVYVTRKHGPCDATLRILGDAGMRFAFVDISEDGEARQELCRETGDPTFPQIFVDGGHWGGFDALLEARDDGRLAALAAQSTPEGGPSVLGGQRPSTIPGKRGTGS